MKNDKKGKRLKAASITRLLFLTSQIFALCWVSLSYGIALYSTVKLGQPFPIETVSETAITVILGTTALKVVENIFEHNNGKFFGESDKEETE